MKIVIQCASGKDPEAGWLVDRGGKRVQFVADPTRAPAGDQWSYARPDDIFEGKQTWRQFLANYNQNGGENLLGLSPAYKLYANAAYRELVEKFQIENIFILSAGWGLIGAEFLTPKYNITFSQTAKGADAYKRRGKKDTYADFCLLPEECSDDLVFLGGKDYLPLFCDLTKSYKGDRHVFYNSEVTPRADGCRPIRFQTTTRTNWHYECAGALVAGKVTL